MLALRFGSRAGLLHCSPMKSPFFLLSSLLLLLTGLAAQSPNLKFDTPLDALMDIPSSWNLTPDRLEQAFPHYAPPEGVVIPEEDRFGPFEWLTSTKERAHFMRRPFSNVQLDFSIFGGEVPVEEVTVDFTEDGKLNGMTLSIYNRGDAGSIDPAEFDRRFKICGQRIGQLLEVRPFPRKANLTQGLLTEGWTWISSVGMAVLEHNPEATEGQIEFLRMRIMPRDATGAMAAAMQSRSGASVKLSDLPRNVIRKRYGVVYIKGLPMVDQGPKGYCVVASAQRLFEYYGIPCDQHQLAQIAGTEAERGTDGQQMVEALSKIDHRFKTRFKQIGVLYVDGKLYEDQRDANSGRPVDQKDFTKAIVDHVDDGIPLLWSLVLGRFPEEPDIAMQGEGLHMRMIIGYNEQEGKLLFSDSWGAGHELKRMKLSDAFQATFGLFVIQPTTR